jgi:chaperone BCS1
MDTFSIEVSSHDIDKFIAFLGEDLTNQDQNDISLFTISINPKNKATIRPHLGEFHWKYENEVYLISYKEEGKPIDYGGPTYFKRLSVKHPNMKQLTDFVTHALTFSKEIDRQKIKLYYNKSRGYWDKFHNVYAQPLEKIFMDEKIKNSIINHIDVFLHNKAKYVRYGRPYKLNFLFTGLPGSGKTSLVKALALKYNRPVYILSFPKNLTDESLIDLITEIKDDSIVLLEDIDAFFSERKAVDINVSFSCVINILDGTLCRGNGVITFLSANNPERLDPALIRPGRIDRIIRFDYPKRSEIEKAFIDLTDSSAGFESFYNKIKSMRISMSGIVDYLFRHPTDFLEAINELIENTQLLEELVNNKNDKMYT